MRSVYMNRVATIVAALAAFLVSGTLNCAVGMGVHCTQPALAAAHKCCGPALERAASCCCHGQTEHVQALRSAAPGSEDQAARIIGAVAAADAGLGCIGGTSHTRRVPWPAQGPAPPATLLHQYTLLLL